VDQWCGCSSWAYSDTCYLGHEFPHVLSTLRLGRPPVQLEPYQGRAGGTAPTGLLNVIERRYFRQVTWAGPWVG
jgi:hypothetical protein